MNVKIFYMRMLARLVVVRQDLLTFTFPLFSNYCDHNYLMVYQSISCFLLHRRFEGLGHCLCMPRVLARTRTCQVAVFFISKHRSSDRSEQLL